MAAQYTYTIAELEAGVLEEIETKGSMITVSLANVTDMTTGTLTFEFSQEDSEILETPDINTIDLSAPTSFTVLCSAIGGMDVTLTGFTGTATNIVIVVNDRD
mgnify:CR=1 FL=1